MYIRFCVLTTFTRHRWIGVYCRDEQGGEAITLAGSGAGRVTSFAGSEFTALTSAVSAAASNNAAVGSVHFECAATRGAARSRRRYTCRCSTYHLIMMSLPIY